MYKRKKILIIDDEIELCQLLKTYFQKKGFDVYLSHTLADGISSLKSNKIDIVFLDNNLPDGSGWQVAPQLAIEWPDIYITLISGYYPKLPTMPETAKYGVIAKPVSFSDIDRNLQNIANC